MRSTIPAILVLICVGFSAVCLALDISDCGSKSGKFNSLTIPNCDMTKDVCDLIRDTNASLEIDFTLTADVSKVTAVVQGIIMDIAIPFPLPHPNACSDPNSGLMCPLKNGETYQYKHMLPVLKSYPKLAVTVKWELRDDHDEDIVCLLIPIKIK